MNKAGSLVSSVILAAWGALAFQASPVASATMDSPWPRHSIDHSSRGADGVRLADVNADGLKDVVTGWEEGGEVRICLNPGRQSVKQAWPSILVGRAPSVEDAVLTDLDQDGAMDVVSSSEGSTKTLWIHWAPGGAGLYSDASKWSTQAVPASRGAMAWMFSVPMQIDGQNGPDLVAAGKGSQAALGWWQVPEWPRHLHRWQWHPLRPLGWIMTLAATDMDGDGDCDIVFSDRKGKRSGCYWLEKTGQDPVQAGSWKEHLIGAQGEEVMFLTLTDLDQDGSQDVVAAIKPNHLAWFRRVSPLGTGWEAHQFAVTGNVGTPKAISAGDLDQDGRLDLVMTCEGAAPPRSGVVWFSDAAQACFGDQVEKDQQCFHDISGPEGVKYDLVELIDLDGDKDLDVLTCEERINLGVIWYENPGGP